MTQRFNQNNYLDILTKLLFLLLFTFGFAQDTDFIIPDSLKNKSYSELFLASIKTNKDTIKSNIYYNTFLQKAKDENDPLRQSRAYSSLAYYAKTEAEKLKLYDQAILKCKESEDQYCLCSILLNRGSYFAFIKHDYHRALDDNLKLLKLAQELNYNYGIKSAKQNIAYLKELIGEHAESLSIFKELLAYQRRLKPRHTHSYIEALLKTARSYTYNKKFDSASVLNKKAIKIILNDTTEEHYNNYKTLYAKLLLNEGINLFHIKSYKQAKDSLIKGFYIYDVEKNNIFRKEVYMLYFYYLGKVEEIHNDPEKAKSHFLQMDSMYKKVPTMYNETRDGYEFLIKYYKNKKDKDKQLTHINNLLRFDSINSYHKDVINRIYKEYDTPTLLKEKEKLIHGLENKNNTLYIWLILILITSGCTAFLLYNQNRKKRVYKEKFDQLLKQQGQYEEKNHKINVSGNNGIEIPENIIENVLEKLSDFENTKQYLKKSITVASLSKELKTNSKYLSKIINHYKGKTFINYINELRINYIVNELKINTTMRKYTIQSIAKDIGFNNAESFASAFKKYTGLNPSYFIKNLNKQEED